MFFSCQVQMYQFIGTENPCFSDSNDFPPPFPLPFFFQIDEDDIDDCGEKK